MAITPDELVRAAERELSMRQRVYPRWVEAKRMSQAKADHEIACMTAIVDLCREKARGERLL